MRVRVLITCRVGVGGAVGGGFGGPGGILPDDEGLVERVEAVAAAAGARGEGQRLLVPVGVGEGESEGVGDAAGGLEGGGDVEDEVLGHRLGRVRKDDVDVAAFAFAPTVAPDDDGFELAVGESTRVCGNRRRDRLHFRPGNLELEFVVVLDADLLHAGQGLPALLDDVVEIAPFPAVVEFSCGQGANAPDLVEEPEHSQDGIGFEIADGLDLAGGVPLLEEMSDFLITAWEREDLTGAGDDVWISAKGGDAGAVGANTNFVGREQASKFDLLELGYESLVWRMQRSCSFTGIDFVFVDPVGHIWERVTDIFIKL